jgi:hypothetical protein
MNCCQHIHDQSLSAWISSYQCYSWVRCAFFFSQNTCNQRKCVCWSAYIPNPKERLYKCKFFWKFFSKEQWPNANLYVGFRISANFIAIFRLYDCTAAFWILPLENVLVFSVHKDSNSYQMRYSGSSNFPYHAYLSESWFYRAILRLYDPNW